MVFQHSRLLFSIHLHCFSTIFCVLFIMLSYPFLLSLVLFVHMFTDVHTTCIILFTLRASFCSHYVHHSVHTTCITLFTLRASFCSHYVHHSVHTTCITLFTLCASLCSHYVHHSVHTACITLFTLRASLCPDIALLQVNKII